LIGQSVKKNLYMKKFDSTTALPYTKKPQFSNRKSDSTKTSQAPTIQTKTKEQHDLIQKEFQNMTTNLNKTLYELSTEHRVVCLFIKWFGCPM
jgi:hypothetical protein